MVSPDTFNRFWGHFLRVVTALVMALGFALAVAAESPRLPTDYDQRVQPLLESYCYGCHGYGSKEGNLALDQFRSEADALAQPELWWKVLKNVRAGIMPPAGEE